MRTYADPELVYGDAIWEWAMSDPSITDSLDLYSADTE